MKQKTVALFDADGTLLDTMGYHADLAAQCIVKHFSGEGVGYQDALRHYHATTGIPFPHQLEKIFPGEQFAERRKLCAEEYAARKESEVYEKAGLFVDVLPALHSLREAGVVSGVSTSTERNMIRNAIHRGGAEGYFWSLYGREDGTKPDHIATTRRVQSPARLFYIGGSLYDAQLHEHGVTTIGRYGSGPGMHTREELLDAGAAHATDDLRDIVPILLAD